MAFFAKGQKINPQEQDDISIPETIFVPESPEPPPTAAQTRAVRREQHTVIQYWDAGCQAMSRLHKGQTVVAEMLPGGDGFQIAVWPDGTRTSTEQANQLAAPVCKKPAGPAPLKRPAAAIRAGSAAGVAAPGFPIYFYKNPPPGAWGLRSSSGDKKQIFQVVASKHGGEWAKHTCIVASQQLAAGDLDIQNAKAWLQARLAAASEDG